MKFNEVNYYGHDESTDLCKLGLKYNADKSPLVAHGYTPFYNFLFSNLKYRDINFGEIGIYENASMKMWREYFSNANLYGWDCRMEDRDEDLNRFYKKDYVENAKQHNLKNTIYDYMDVASENSINEALEKTQIKFDVLIDDSDHQFWSQIKLLRNVYKFLKPGGMFIIEDLMYNFVDILEELKLFGHDKHYDVVNKINLYDQNLKYKKDPLYLLVFVKK
jgi:hypothetical protein